MEYKVGREYFYLGLKLPFYGTSLVNPWPNNLVVSNLRVSDLLNTNDKQHNHVLLLTLVGIETAHKVQNTPLFDSVQHDKLYCLLKILGAQCYRYCINEAIDTSHLTLRQTRD